MSTINFACKKISIEQILRCGFGLNKTEYKILKYLLNTESEAEIEDIAKSIKKDRTTTQRAIKKLVESSLVFRRQINLSPGGFRFVYSVKNKADVKKKAYSSLCSFQDLVENELKKW